MIPFFRRNSINTGSINSLNVPDFLAPLTIITRLNKVPIRFNSSSSNSNNNDTNLNSTASSSSSSSSSNSSSSSKNNYIQERRVTSGNQDYRRGRSTPRKPLLPDLIHEPIPAKKLNIDSAFNPIKRDLNRNPKRRKPLVNNIDPLDLLIQIRNSNINSASSTILPDSNSTNSSSTSTNSSNTTSNKKPIVRIHPPSQFILAHKNVQVGSEPTVQDYELAFERGWKVLRDAGQVGRLRIEDFEALLLTVMKEFNSVDLDGNSNKKVTWIQVKELLLWMSGMTLMPTISNWAWDSLKGGSIGGSERVVELWEAIMAGEPKKMRSMAGALDRHSKPYFPTDSAANKAPVLDSRLFGAYIVARSILNSSTTAIPPPTFKDELPSFLDPSHPAIGRYLTRNAIHRTDRNFIRNSITHTQELESIFESTPNSIASILKGESWLGQIHLAQVWLRTGRGDGLGIILAINLGFRRDDQRVAIRFWELIKEGVESNEVGWIEDKWEMNKNNHLFEGMPIAEIYGSSIDGSVATTTATLPEVKIEVEDSTSTFVERPSSAYLTEALLAPFLVGFVRAKLYDRATEIWNWLDNPSRPLTPGVVTWTALLRGYAVNSDTEAVETVWSQMIEAGIKPDSITWINKIEAYFRVRDLVKASETLQKMFLNKELREGLKDGNFDEEIYRKLIGGFLSIGKVDKAKLVLEDMIATGVKPTIQTYNLFIKSYTSGSRADFTSIVKTLRIISEQNLDPDVITFTMILKGLLSVDQGEAVAKLVSIMENSGVKPTVTTYGSIINSLTTSGSAQKLRAAIELLDEMEKSGMKTNEIIYTSIIQGFIKGIKSVPTSDLPSVQEGEVHPYLRAALTLRSRMQSRNIPMNRIGYNALIDASLYMNSELGNQLAFDLYKELESKLSMKLFSSKNEGEEEVTGSKVTPADTWFVLLNGFAQNSDWSNARGVLRMMQENKFISKSQVMKRLEDKVIRGGKN